MSLKRRLFVGANRLLEAMPRALQRRALAAAATLPVTHRLPRFMAVEPTNACNLKCPLCPVGAGTMDRAVGFMPLEAYRRLIDEIATHTRRILMNFAGEPLLHPHIGEMVRLAAQRNVQVTLGTHGNIDRMQELVDAGLTEVLFSLDGTTQETYGRYRIGGSLEVARANLRKLVAARDAAPGRRTRVILQFVVMRHNAHQVDEVVSLGRELGVDQVSLQPVCVNDFFREDLAALVERWVPTDSPYLMHPETIAGGAFRRPPLCVWAIQSVVLWNGDVTICCFDASGSTVVGNAFGPGGFAAVWNDPAYRTARRGVLLQDFPICRRCDVGLVKPTRFAPDESGAVRG